MTDDDALKQALAELGDMVRCRCDEAYRDRDLQDPECQCDSMDAVRVVIARIEWLERERVLDAKLLVDTQALLDTALEAVIDAKLVAEAKLAEVEKERDAAKTLLDKAAVALEACVASLERADTSEVVCCCGDSMDGHASPMDCGHNPTDMGDYYAGLALEAARAALTTENQTNG